MKPIIVYDHDTNGIVTILGVDLILTVAILLLVAVIAFYVLRSIGLYTLCKRFNIKKAILCWIPCLWIFPTCKIVGNSKFLNYSIEKLALFFTIIFSVITFSGFISNFISYFPRIMAFLQGAQVNLVMEGGVLTAIGVENFVNPLDVPFLNILRNIFAYIGTFGEIINIIIMFVIFFPFFRKLWPQHYLLAGFLSFIGLFGVFAFVVRKKEVVDFEAYMRARYYNAYGNQYGNPNYRQGQNGFNNRQNYNQSSGENDSPFSEFDKSNEKSPFTEFESKNGEQPFEEFDSNKKDNS